MNRDDWIWLAIRFAGLYLLLLTLLALVKVAGSGLMLMRPPFDGFLHSDKTELAAMAAQLWRTVLTSAVEAFVFVVAGLYLARRGGRLFRFLSRRDPEALKG